MILSISQGKYCSRVVGAEATVCAYDRDYPDAHFDSPESLNIYRNGNNGNAWLTKTVAYCDDNYWQGAHGALGAGPQGAALSKPTVTPIKKKTV